MDQAQAVEGTAGMGFLLEEESQEKERSQGIGVFRKTKKQSAWGGICINRSIASPRTRRRKARILE